MAEKTPINKQQVLARGQAVMSTEANAIEQAAALLDQSFVDVVEAVVECKGRVCLTGVGKAGLIGNKIQATLASTGTLSYTLHPNEALHGDLGMVHADDLIIALSKSGTSEVAQLLPILKGRGCQIVLVTSEAASPAARFADHILLIGPAQEACPLGLAPSASTAAMLAVGDALALAVMEQKAVQPEHYASFHPGGALGRSLMKVSEIMRTAENSPTVPLGATLGDWYDAIKHAPQRAGSASIVDQEGRLVGIITHGDFFRLFKSERCSVETPVADVMIKNPKRIVESQLVMDAIRLMSQHSIDELPVVDDDQVLVGIIDVQDLMMRGFLPLDNGALSSSRAKS